MKAKQETEGQAGPVDINIEFQDSKGRTQRRTFNYGNGADRQDFYDSVHELKKDMDKGKKEE